MSHGLNVFANESFMDELAAAAEGSLEYRRALLAKQPRPARAQDGGREGRLGKPLPQGRAPASR